MPSRKSTNNPLRSRKKTLSVFISPVRGVKANEQRSEWAANAIAAFTEVTEVEPQNAVRDLLANIGHWADISGTNLRQEFNRARVRYEGETSGEGTQFIDQSPFHEEAVIRRGKLACLCGAKAVPNVVELGFRISHKFVELKGATISARGRGLSDFSAPWTPERLRLECCKCLKRYRIPAGAHTCENGD